LDTGVNDARELALDARQASEQVVISRLVGFQAAGNTGFQERFVNAQG
jgi:hypothetical protein